jgi:hypothetical protein
VFAADCGEAIGPEENSGQDDLRVSGGDQIASFIQRGFYILVTNLGPDFWYDTIGTQAVAAVLNLQKGAAMPGEGFQRRQRQDSGLVKISFVLAFVGVWGTLKILIGL